MKKITKTIISVLCVAAIGGGIAAVSGCDGREKIIISGSSSVTPLMEKLAAEYEKDHNVRIQVNMSSSGSGISDAQEGLNDFGMSSRYLKDGETGVKGETLCMDGIALIVNSECTTSDVTTEQVYNLFVNGTAVNSEITAGIGRDSGSGTRDAFNELVGIENDAYHTSIGTQAETGNVISVIETSKNSLGYISYGSLSGSSKIKAVSFNGVECTVANILNQTYALQRPFVIVLSESRTLSEAAQGFYDYIMSDAAQTIIESNGYVSIK